MATPIPAPHLGRRRLLQLGRQLLLSRPDVARELLTQMEAVPAPLERDYGRLEGYFQHFCRLQDLCPNDYRGPLYKSHKLERIKVFVACVLHLYAPGLQGVPSDALQLPYGLVKALSHTLGKRQPNVTTMIREVLVMERAYEEFRAQVAHTYVQLKPESHGRQA